MSHENVVLHQLIGVSPENTLYVFNGLPFICIRFLDIGSKETFNQHKISCPAVYNMYVFGKFVFFSKFGQKVAKKWPKNWVPGFFQ